MSNSFSLLEDLINALVFINILYEKSCPNFSILTIYKVGEIVMNARVGH